MGLGKTVMMLALIHSNLPENNKDNEIMKFQFLNFQV